jgi:hypothetical protein
MPSAHSARAITTIHELIRGAAPDDGAFGAKGVEVSFQHFGIYYGDIARTGDSWMFTHRLVVPIYFESGAVTGEVVSGRASLLYPQAP